MRTSSAFLLICMLAAAPCTYGQSASIMNDPEVRLSLDIFASWMEHRMAFDRIPGVTVGIVRNQDLVWEAYYGYADVERKRTANRHTLYSIASNTKMFTAIAVLRLRDQGRITLEDPIVRYIPEAAGPTSGSDDPNPVRIRHLLTHTAAYPQDPVGIDFDARFIPPIDSVIAHLPRQLPAWMPGIRWKYSNLGVALLGRVITTVTGVPYERYVTDSILTPIGMMHSTFSPDAAGDAIPATGYLRRMPDNTRAVIPPIAVEGMNPAGGIWSCLDDLARYVSWVFRVRGGGSSPVLSGPTLRDMQSVHWVDPSWKEGFGYGFIIAQGASCPVLIGHGGHLPGFRTECTISSDDTTGVVILANADDLPVYFDIPGSASDRLFRWVIPAMRSARTRGTPAAAPDPSLLRFIGRFRSMHGDVQILARERHLVMFDPADPPPVDDMTQLTPVGTLTFRYESNDGYSVAGEQLDFVPDPDGSIVSFTLSGVHYQKRAAW